MVINIAEAVPYAYIANQGDNTVSVIDTANDAVTATIPVGNGPLAVAISPDGKKAYVANYQSDTISVIDTATNTVTSTVTVGDNPYGIAVSPDGTRLYVAKMNSDAISVIDTTTNAIIATVKLDGSPRGVVVSPDGSKVYVANYNSACISVINTETNTVTSTVDVGNYPCGIAISPDGSKIYVTNTYDDDTVYIIDTATNSVVGTIPVGSRPLGIAVSPDGSKVYVANNGDNTTSIIDTTTNTVTSTVNIGYAPEGIAVTPNGSKIYVTNYGSNNVYVINTGNNSVLSKITVGQRPISIGTFIGPLTVSVLPVAKFSANITSGTAPLMVQFTDLSENSTSWNWDFGDGTSSTQKDPVHTYSKAGKYNVSLTVTNNVGSNTATKTSYIIVTDLTAPVAAFSASPTSGSAPLNVKFTDKSTGSPTSWRWSFGDGVVKSSQNPIHKYSQTGTYTVKLTVTNEKGSNTTTKTSYIKVIIKKPVAAFSASPTSGSFPLKVQFTDKSTGAPTSWRWVFEDGDNTTVKSSQNPVHIYSQVGTYTVKLTVTNSAGSNTTISSVTVKSPLQVPVASFTASPTSGSSPLNVQFTDKSTGTPTEWKWNFGDGSDIIDGTTSAYQNPTHTYSQAGTYTVKETAINELGRNTTTKTSYITVKSSL
jgi:YVTN family beta-propeller protein